MSTNVRWLREQTEKWVAQGVVSADQAARIRAFYPEPAAGLPWAMLIFSGLGAVVVGLGVILLFAYNWDALPRGVKLAVILGAWGAAHGAGLWRLRGDVRWRGLGEALGLLGTMMFGAAIWLIAQIYNIEEHFPNGFLYWGLGALALAWALPSAVQGLMAAVLLAIWSGSEAAGFGAPVLWAPAAILAATVPLAWRQNSVALLFVAVAAASVATWINAGAVGSDLVLRTGLSLGALWVAVGALSRQRQWLGQGAWVWSGLGWAQVLLAAYLLSFPGLAYELLAHHEYSGVERDAFWQVNLWLPLGVAIAAWAAVAVGGRDVGIKPSEVGWRYEDWVTLAAALVAAALAYVPLERGEWLASGLFNLLGLLLAVAWMARGCREGRWQPTLAGTVLFVALALARYFDLFESLAWRGLVFLVAGGALFATGMQYTRARKRRDAEKGGAS
ncbi:MAG: DUF2157 domain-containing protein [Verrucomicrobia bacterium]|nr:DUF2157 domain-containing protein [Verrucomicrobiota bacterium]